MHWRKANVNVNVFESFKKKKKAAEEILRVGLDPSGTIRKKYLKVHWWRGEQRRRKNEKIYRGTQMQKSTYTQETRRDCDGVLTQVPPCASQLTLTPISMCACLHVFYRHENVSTSMYMMCVCVCLLRFVCTLREYLFVRIITQQHSNSDK